MQDLVLTPPMSSAEVTQLVDLEEYIQETTGEYYDFASLHDAKTFADSLEYYMGEGFSVAMAEEFTKRDMDL